MGLKANHHRAWLNEEARLDIKWWDSGCESFHGYTQFIQDLKPPCCEFSTDSCLTGGGGEFNGDWYYVNFESDYPEYAKEHINTLELLTVVIAARRWGPLWGGTHICVRSDNSSTVHAINKGTSKSKKFMVKRSLQFSFNFQSY